MAPVRWGILSTGHIASVLARDLALLPDEAELVAVGSRRQESADAFAEQHGWRGRTGRTRSWLADPDLDVIYVASIHNDHFASARMCLEAGKAVLVEKPLTVTADAERRADRTGAAARTVLDGGHVDPDPSPAPPGR